MTRWLILTRAIRGAHDTKFLSLLCRFHRTELSLVLNGTVTQQPWETFVFNVGLFFTLSVGTSSQKLQVGIVTHACIDHR